MTLLFVTHYAGFYGANRSLLTMMVLLRERHDVTPLVLLPNKGAMCAMLEKYGIEYSVQPYYWWVNYNHGLFQWALNKRKQWINCRRAKSICSHLEGKSIDMVYSNSVCVNIGYLVARRFGLPHVWQFRESLTHFSLSLSLSLSRRIFASSVNKRFVLISDYMMSFYRSYLPNDRMVRVYNGVDLPDGMVRSNENQLKGRLQVACIGVISKQKNQMELLQAQSLLHQRGIDIDTWFVGSFGEKSYYETLKDYVQSNDLDDLAHFVGHSNRVFDILQQMNLGVVTARDEAFGRVTIEYMLMQMPVVVNQSGANLELVEVGVTGGSYELHDVESLADRIEQYVCHPNLLKSQGEAASRIARERFSAGQNAELIFEQIESVLKKD